MVDDGSIVFATLVRAAFAAGSVSVSARPWADLEICCKDSMIFFRISPTFIFSTESAGGEEASTLLIISFHTGNKAGLSSYDLPGTSWNPSRVQTYHQEYTTHDLEAVCEHT